MRYSKSDIIKCMLVFLIAGCILIAGSNGSAREQDKLKVVEVTASAALDGGNIPASKEQAISAGLVSAVALASSDILPIDAQIEHFKKLNQDLYGHVDKFIQDYKVMTELVTADQYRVVVQATVMMDRVREQLSDSGIILSKKEIPSVLFFIAEKTLEGTAPIYWWGEKTVYAVPSSEETMADVLRKNGFTVVSHGNLVEPLNHDLDISVAEATAIGRHLNADIVVVGSSQVQQTSNVMGGNIRSYKSSVDVKAYTTDTGKALASVARAAIVAGDKADEASREALANAGAFTGEELSAQIIAARLKAASTVPSVEIVVIGTDELKNFVKFRKVLGTISGVSGIDIKEIKSNESTIEVEYPESGERLAEELMLKTYDTFGIDIYEVAPGRLGIELIPEE